MNKEMFISSSPHETKVAVCEDGQLVEVYFERDTDVGLVGGIYKGRVNRVLPGMQSAFVDIGLERDAFLYVSDFSLQDQDEFEGALNESQTRGATIEVEPQGLPAAPETGEKGGARQEQAEGAGQTEALPKNGRTADESSMPRKSSVAGAAETMASEPSGGRLPGSSLGGPGDERGPGRRSHRGRRHRRHGRGGFGERRHTRYSEPHPAAPEEPAPAPARASEDFEILPGESLAKYSHSSTEDSASLDATRQASSYGSASEPASAPEMPGSDNIEHDAYPSKSLQTEETLAEVQGEGYAEAGEKSSQTDSQRFFTPVPEASSASAEAAEGGAEDQLHTTYDVPEAPENLPDFELAVGEEAGQAGEAASDESGAETRLETSASESESGEEDNSEGPEQASETTEAGDESSERSYTLREPHSRPHFAPRRGRRGRRAGRHSRRNAPRERESTRAGGQQGLQISELLKEGQEIIVQIAKEPLGTKGARITSHVALPGRYIVYMPTISHIGVSRKISSEQERLRLRNIILENKGSLTGGFIVRTAGEGRSDDEIKADLKFLTNLWNEIRNRAEQVKAPALLYRDLDLAQRLMRDLVAPDFKSIWLDNEADYERVVEFINRLQPSLLGCAKLHTRQTPLFEEHGIEEEIEKALRPKVWLKSGGYIVINQTEALVAIDVNTGKYVGKTNRLEDTIVKTNIDAVNEIVRQIRLRDLGGIIVIDFIDMDERRNRNKVVQALEEALRRDRAPTKVLSFNDFGLVAVTRKRVKQSLERTLCDPCTYCSGSGWVKSVTTISNEILAEARKMASEIDGKTMTLRVNPEVAQALKSKDGTLITEIESLTHKNLVVKSDPTVHQERFEIF